MSAPLSLQVLKGDARDTPGGTRSTRQRGQACRPTFLVCRVVCNVLTGVTSPSLTSACSMPPLKAKRMPRCIRGGQYPRQALGRGQAAARRMAATARGRATPTSCATRRPSLDAVDDLWKRDSQCVNVVLPRTGMPCEFMAMAAARTGSLGSQLLLHARRIGRLCRPAYKSDGAWTVWSSSTWDWMVNCASPRELAGCVEQGIVSCPSVVRVELETEWKKREKRGEERQETQESGESGLRSQESGLGGYSE